MSKKSLLLLVVVIILATPIFVSLSRRSAIPTRFQTDMVAPNMMEKRQDSAASSGVSPVPPMNQDGKIVSTTDRTIVKQASLSVVANDAREFVNQATNITKQMSGLVTTSNVYENKYQPGVINADMTIRVPVDKLEETLTKLKSLAAKVSSENVSASDQTETKVDLEAQLHNLQATEQQLLTIMKQANTVEETLQVQTQLTQVRDRIERLQASLENLLGSAAMSTIHISVSTKESALPVVKPNQTSIWEEIKLAVRDTISIYRELLVVGMRYLIIGSPLLVIGLIIYWMRRGR